jgi:predicted N-acetyltransferase YhbS
MIVLDLRDCGAHVPSLLAGWHHAEWGELMAPWALDDALTELLAHRDGEFPATFVAIDGDTVLGSASLIDEDAPAFHDLSPWLASVYVLPGWRGRGIATALIEAVLRRAHRLGFAHIHLFTDGDGTLYRRLGFAVLEHRWLGAHQVAIYRRSLP